MRHPNRDVSLPWQYTVLALMWVGGFVALGVLAFASIRGMAPADVRAQVRPFPIAYLVVAVILTPLLIVGGRRQVRRWRDESAGASGAEHSALGRVTSVSPAKGVAISAVACVSAVLPLGGVLSGSLDPIAGFAMAGALLAAGIIGLVRHSGRT